MTATTPGAPGRRPRRPRRSITVPPNHPSLRIPFDHIIEAPPRRRTTRSPGQGRLGGPRGSAVGRPDSGRSPGRPGTSRAPGRLAPDRAPGRTVRAATRLTPETLAQEAFVEPGSPTAAAVEKIWELGREESRALARRMRAIEPFHRDRENLSPDHDAVDEADLAVAVAMRMSTQQAAALIYDAYAAVHRFPRTLERLEAGEMPAEWFHRLLRVGRRLTPRACEIVDDRVSQWQLCSIPVARFRRELKLLAAWATTCTDAAPPAPESLRHVAMVNVDAVEGTATMQIVGPIPEMLSLGHRLDAAARTIQQAQRHALESGAEIPFDIDGTVESTGKPMTLAQLRYAALTRTVLETGGVEVGPDRFRMNVTVPVLTLLGASDAPGLVEGQHPLPAAMARELAAGEPVWYRVLTDPVTGIFLPAAADTYRPTPRMLGHLRLRHPVCAAPGCTRSTRLGAEADHIEEFDHHSPLSGGLTELSNLHLLCWQHHRTKSSRRIDPVRLPASTAAPAGTPLSDTPPSDTPPPGAPPGSSDPPVEAAPVPAGSSPITIPPPTSRTRWQIGDALTVTIEDHRDMMTPEHVRTLTAAWKRFEELQDALNPGAVLNAEAILNAEAARGIHTTADIHQEPSGLADGDPWGRIGIDPHSPAPPF